SNTNESAAEKTIVFAASASASSATVRRARHPRLRTPRHTARASSTRATLESIDVDAGEPALPSVAIRSPRENRAHPAARQPRQAGQHLAWAEGGRRGG